MLDLFSTEHLSCELPIGIGRLAVGGVFQHRFPPHRRFRKLDRLAELLPQLANEEIEGYYPVDRAQLHGGTFFHRVTGNSMIGAAILEGDLALIRPQATAENGDIVVAMVGSEATLKRFYRDRNYIRLQPANPDMEPILIHPGEEVSILGKVVKIVRDLE